MGFVLVPVPAEYVLDVMRWVLFRSDAEGTGDVDADVARVTALLANAEPEVRALLEVVAEATIRNEPVRMRDLADELGQVSADVSDAIEALNASTLDGGRELLEVRSETAVGVDGQKGRITYVSMRPLLARVVRMARHREEAG